MPISGCRSTAVSYTHLKAQKNAEIEALGEKEQEQTEALSRARNAYILQYPSSGFSGSEKSNEGYEQLLAQYEKMCIRDSRC